MIYSLRLIVLAIVVLVSAELASAATLSWHLSASSGVEEAAGDPAENGDPVAIWVDQVGSDDASQASGTNRPTYVTNVINSQPAVQFSTTLGGGGLDANGDFLTAATGPAIIQSFTVFLVGRVLGNQANAFDYFYDGTTGSNRVILLVNPTGSNENQMGIYASNDVMGAFTEAQWQQWHIYEAVYNGSSSSLFADGSLVASGNVGATNISALTIGGRFSDPFRYSLNGFIADMRIYAGALTEAERNQIGYGLEITYGLETAYVPEPSTWLLTACAIAALGLLRKRQLRTRL